MMWIGLFSRELGRDFRHSLSVIKVSADCKGIGAALNDR